MNDLLTRAVANVIPKKLAEEKLQSGKKLHIYWGIDPTGSKLHLGHAVSLRKLQQFVDAGHEIILVIGSFTAMIGDPSGRDELRQPLTHKQIEENFHTYKEQAAKVLDFSKITVRYNHEWLEKLTPELMVKLASHFTKQQMEQREKFVLTLKLLEGTDGRKMSKTYENCIYLEDSPNEMFGKLMSIKDSLMETYFECCTDAPMDEVRVILSSSKDGMGPRDAKARLARAIVTLYHGAKEADAAEKEFTNVFSKGKLPKEIPEIISTGDDPLGELVRVG